MMKVDRIKNGDVFGRLTVIGGPIIKDCGLSRSRDGRRQYVRKRTQFTCQCKCGDIRDFDAYRLLNGDVRSCGCLKKDFYKSTRQHKTEKGDWNTPLYQVWQSMIRRCYNPKAPNRKYYYDRGIEVCQLWREDFSAFKKWANDNGYKKGLQIDRIDVDGNYEPLNCRWITPKANAHNRRYHAEVIYKGEKKKLVDVMDEVGCLLDEHTVWKRIFLHKWDIERALTEGRHYAGKRGKIVLEYQGRKITTRDIAEMTGLNTSAIRNRLFKQGMSLEQVISETPKTHKNKWRTKEMGV